MSNTLALLTAFVTSIAFPVSAGGLGQGDTLGLNYRLKTQAANAAPAQTRTWVDPVPQATEDNGPPTFPRLRGGLTSGLSPRPVGTPPTAAPDLSGGSSSGGIAFGGSSGSSGEFPTLSGGSSGGISAFGR